MNRCKIPSFFSGDLIGILPASSVISEYGFILGRKRGEKTAVIAGVCFLGATKCLCYLKEMHFVNATKIH